RCATAGSVAARTCMVAFPSNLCEGHRLAVESRHNLLSEGTQAGDRSARGGEQYILDPTRFQALQPGDNLLRGAEQRRVVEHERSLVLLDVGVLLRPRAAGEIADVLQHIPAGDDRPLTFLLVVHDLQSAGNPDHRRIVRPAYPLAFMAEGRHTVDYQIGGCDLVEQQIVPFARGTADRCRAAGTQPKWGG